MTPSEIKALSDPIVKIYEQLTDDLMLAVANQLATYGTMTSTAEWQITKLSQMGSLNQQTIKTIAAETKTCPELIHVAVENAAYKAASELEPAFQAAARAGVIGETVDIAASPGITQALTYYQRQAKDTLNLVNTVMAYKTRDAYTGIVNKAVNIVNRDEYLATLGKNTASVVTGAQSRTAALRQCIKEFSEQGIPGFVDKAGREWSPEAYLNMDIRTTVNNVAHEAQFSRMDDYNTDLIEVSSHLGARPRCAPFQGRLYSRSGGSGFTEDLDGNRIYYGSWDDTSYGEPAGLLGINCGHQIYPFWPGLSKQTHKPYDTKENDKRYSESQHQRYLERQVRNSKRECAMLDTMGDKEGFDKAALQLKQRQSALNDYVSATNRTIRSDRTQVLGYNRSVAGKAAQSITHYDPYKVATVKAIGGARITNIYGKPAQAHAEKYYGLIRSMKTDVSRIAKNTGFNETEIRQIKNFLFNEKHDLGGGRIDRFDPDFSIAQSWQRLVDGKLKPHDLTLIRHEMMERELMCGGLSQHDAHIRASTEHNYTEEVKAYYADAKKRKNK